MHFLALAAWTLLVPAIRAIVIETHYGTSSTQLCSTIYGPTSKAPSGTSHSIPTQTLEPTTTEVLPIMLHNSTTITKTITPKPSSTYLSHLETWTVWASNSAVDGTFETTETVFATATSWKSASTTETATRYRYLTSRTTSWIPLPSGFVPVRNSSSEGEDGVESKRAVGHPHAPRADKAKSLKMPTAGQKALSVECKPEIQLQTTEVLFLTYSKTATTTLPRETIYRDKTVWGTITMTVLIPSSPAKRDETTSLSTTIPSTTSSPSPTSTKTRSHLIIGPNGITTAYHTTTKTPYTLTSTSTSTSTTTTTLTLHATKTTSSHLACAATQNSLSQTSNTQLINGFFLPSDEETNLITYATEDEKECCELCMAKDECTWNVWEVEGRDKGTCYLWVAGEEGVCGSGGMGGLKGAFGFKKGREDGRRFVVGNGVCGILRET